METASTQQQNNSLWNYLNDHHRETIKDATEVVNGELSIEEFIKKQKTPGTWGGEIALKGISTLYKTNVLLHQVHNNTIMTMCYPNTQVHDKTINLYLETGANDEPLHYFTSYPYPNHNSQQ